MALDLNLVGVFLAVAEAKSFRGAAERLGVTRSAVSQAIRRMEDRMGVALVQRTTRSVSLTEAGVQLHQRVAPAIAEVELALDTAQDRDAKPTGQLRLAVSSIAERFICGPLLAGFTHAHPGVQVDITVTDEEFDIVAEGYDAGVRLGEVIEQDMIAVPVSGDQRQMVVAAPSYLERFGAPSHPAELSQHCCIGWRPGSGGGAVSLGVRGRRPRIRRRGEPQDHDQRHVGHGTDRLRRRRSDVRHGGDFQAVY